MVAKGVSRVRVHERLRQELAVEDRVREFGQRVDLFPGGLLIEADGSVAGMAYGGHRQVLLVARRAVLFAGVPPERLARFGAVVCSAANAFSVDAITVALSSTSGRVRRSVAIVSARGGSLAPAATRASTIAVPPRFSAISRAVCGTSPNAPTG